MTDTSMFLTDDEVIAFTGFKRPSLQMEWLGTNGHQFVMNGRGRVIASRSYVENLLGGKEIAKRKREKQIEPNWDAAK